MSYSFKLIELIELNNGFAKIRILIDQDEKLYWLQLDDLTFTSLSETVNAIDGSLMRLSLISKRDPFTNTYTSVITSLRGYEQRKIDFNCTEFYAEQVEKIKWVESFNNLEQFDFIQLVDRVIGNQVEQENNQSTETHDLNPKKKNADRQPDEWSTFSVDEIVERGQSSGFENSFLFPKHLRKGLIASLALALMFAFSTEQFLATETEEVQHNQDLYLLKTDLEDHLPQVRRENIDLRTDGQDDDLVQTSLQTNKSPFPMFKIEQSHFYSLPKGYVALTFDDGPSIFTKDIADVLEEHEVAGTFFFVGTQIEKYPDFVTYVDQQGHSIGSHSYGHQNLTQYTPSVIEDDILRTIAGIEGLVGEEMDLFRPPFGATNEKVVDVTREQGLKTVMWNRDPRDWEAGNKETIIDYFKRVDPSGGVYILHENRHTLEALPEILSYLESQGLKIVGLK